MKRFVFLGTALTLVVMLLFSCNKNRFELDHLESAQGSGQWKLPIGSMHVSTMDVLNQLGENNLISQDAAGNLLIRYSFPMENLIEGYTMLNLGTFNSTATFHFDKPEWEKSIIDTVFIVRQAVPVDADSASIVSAKIKEGTLIQTYQGNLTSMLVDVWISSPNIIMADGDSLSTDASYVDLAGASLSLGQDKEATDTLYFNYAIHCLLEEITEPSYDLTSIIGISNLKLSELSGYIDSYVYEYSQDSSFSLGLSNLHGQFAFVDAQMRVEEKNTFGNLNAQLRIDRAEFYGGDAQPSSVFSHYPYVLNLVESPTYTDITPAGETTTIGINTEYDRFGFDAAFNLNPDQESSLVTITDTSSLSLKLHATIPLKFNSTGISYLDTMNLNMSSIETPDILKQILLTASFDSEMPLNLNAQFYTLDPVTNQITDSLVMNPLHIGASFNGKPVHSESQISVTHKRLEHLLESNGLMMRFNIDTDGHDAVLTNTSGLTVTLKADVVYGGEENF